MSASKQPPQTMDKKSDDSGIVSIIWSALKKASVVGIVYLVGYMNWSIAWFIGPVVLSVMRDQWKKSNDRKRTIAKAAALASEQDVVLARLNDLPAWVFFPDVERTEWLNKIIKQVWPNVNQFVREMVRDSIQPALRENLEKYKLNGFKFQRIILGTVPFRIGGVKVYDKNVDRNEIVMDLDIFYAGDCDISFSLAGMKGGIRDFQLHGMLRVVAKPLISSIPLIGGLQVFFLNNPDIDFDLVGVADVLDMPGLSDILRRIVVETVASMMVLPNKFPIKLSEEVAASDIKVPQPEGVLRIHVLEARHLMKKDIGMLGKGKSDPYAVLTLGAQEFKTKTINNSVDPVWDCWCEFSIMETIGQELFIHLWDKDDAGDDESLGRASVEIANIVKKGQDDVWITLEQAKHGMLHLRLTWFSLSKNYSDLKTVLTETQNLRASNLNTGLLTVYLDSVKNLPQARISSKPDAYAVLKVGNLTQQTGVQMRTIHPVWEQGFTFLVPNPESHQLTITIMDQKTNTEIGTFSYKISNLSTKDNMEVLKEPFSLLKSGPQSKMTMSLYLRIFKYTEAVQEAVQSDADTMQADQPQTPEVAQEVVEEVQKQTTEALESPLVSLSDSPKSNDGLLHRAPSVTSSAGEAGLGRIQLTLRYSVQRQRLVVVVHKIANIPQKDPSNIPDPYVKLYLLPERAKDSKRKTTVIKDQCNPVFDETFEYVINQVELPQKQLEVTVCTQKQLFYSSSNILGMVLIDLGVLPLTQPYSAWFDMQPEQ